MLRDFRHAFHLLRRQRSFTLACIVTLALAIGVATSVFSAVNSVLLRPVNLPHPDRLALLWSVEADGDNRGPVSFADFEDWRKNSHSLQAAAVYNSYDQPVLNGAGHGMRLPALRVSHDYFRVLQAKPALGRFFVPAEDWEGQDNVVVLSHNLWRERFHSNPQIVGRRVSLDGIPCTVVGVAPSNLPALPRSLGGAAPQLYRPVGEERGEKSRDARHLNAILRLKPGVSLQQAQAELTVLCRAMQRQHPAADAKLAVRLIGIQEDLTRNLKGGLIGLQAAVLAVLLIACANLASLFLARSNTRARELAVRLALGAGKWRLARMLLAESLLLSLAGGALGLLLSSWTGTALNLASAKALSDAIDFPLDLRVLFFSAFLSVTTGLFFGLAPVLQIFSAPIENSLRDGGRSVAGSRRQTPRRLLAASQIAVAVVLLISAALLGRSFLLLSAVKPGFEARGVLTAGLSLSTIRYPSENSRVVFCHQLLAKLQSLPGVTQAALVTPLPLSGNFDTTSIQILGQPAVSAGERGPDRYVVTPNYFAAARVALLQGRLFTAHDEGERQPVAVISQTAARLLFPGQSPLGKMIRVGSISGTWDQSPFRQVVGIVGDVAQYGLGLPARPQVYLPYDQFVDRFVTLLLRTTGDPSALAVPLRRTVLALDSEEPLYNVTPFQSLVDDSLAGRRFATWLLGAFALGAFALASFGIYGLLSYQVVQRRQEFGIRAALGATYTDILRHSVGAGIPIILAGTALGVAGSLVASRFLASFLFGIGSADLAVFASVPLAMILVALAACYLPARRAARIDPAEALKYE